jgi:hypothetical protein
MIRRLADVEHRPIYRDPHAYCAHPHIVALARGCTAVGTKPCYCRWLLEMTNQLPASNTAQWYKLLSPAKTSEATGIFLPGMPALAFALASMATCFGVILVELCLGVKPHSLGLNPHVQASVMWALGLMAVHALWQDSPTSS